MKTNLVLLLTVLNIQILNAQPYFHKQWDKRYGGTDFEELWSLKQVIDGGCILGGSSASGISGDKTQANIGTEDFWIVKVNSTGNKEWDKRFGGVFGGALTALQPSLDGGYILGGFSGGAAGGDKTEPGRGGWDYWVVKTDAQGNKQWDKTFGGNRDDLLWCLVNTREGGYILGGRSGSGISGDKTETNRDATGVYFDYWVVKIDSMGLKQWDKRFGGTDDDDLWTVEQTLDGGYILGGFSFSRSGGDKTEDNWDTTINHSTTDYWVVKIDSAGQKEWDMRFGGGGTDKLHDIIEMNGGYMLSGSTGSLTSGNKGIDYGPFWLVKIDNSGNKVWETGYSGGAYPVGTSQTNDGGYLLTGDTYNPASIDSNYIRTELSLGSQNTWVLKIDSNGLKQWDKTIFTMGIDERGYAVQTADGCYAVANTSKAGIGGYKTQAAWDSSYDYWIMKFCMDTVTGIDDRHETQDTRQIQVYPNPFSSDLSIALKGENIHEATFTITNALGQLIYKREETNLSSNYTKVLDLSYLPGGFYFITVTQNGELFTKKVVKE